MPVNMISTVYKLENELGIDRFSGSYDGRVFDSMRQTEITSEEAVQILKGLARGRVSNNNINYTAPMLENDDSKGDVLLPKVFVQNNPLPNDINNPLAGEAPSSN